MGLENAMMHGSSRIIGWMQGEKEYVQQYRWSIHPHAKDAVPSINVLQC